MKLEDLPENFTSWDFIKLDKEVLDVLPYDIFKWKCCVRGCENGTTVRDYGISPFYFLNRNTKAALKNPRDYWKKIHEVEVSSIWFCGKHWKFYERLGDEYTRKYFDKNQIEFVKKVNQSTEHLG